MTLARLVLVRHAESDFNAEGRMQGQLDSELTVLGVRQVREAAPVLCRYRPQRLVSSDLRRTARTAAAVGEECGLPVKLDPRLRETHLGLWQGLTLAEVEYGWPGALASWRTDATFAPPDGESRVQVAARVMPSVLELVDEFGEGPERTVVLFAHGGVIASLSCALMRLPHACWAAMTGPGNCRWTVLRRRATIWRLDSHNVGCGPPV